MQIRLRFLRPAASAAALVALTTAGSVALAAPVSADMRTIAAAQCEESQGCASAAADSQGRVYVAGQRRVYVLAADGTPIRTLTGAPSVGQFTNVADVALDAADNAYVADGEGPVQVFGPDGGFLRSIPNSEAVSVAVDPSGNVFIVRSGGTSVAKFDADGDNVGFWPWNSTGLSLSGIKYSAFDGRLYVADRRRIVALNRAHGGPDGALDQVGGWGPFDIDIGNTADLAVDEAGAVYVTGYTPEGTHKFSPSGQLLGSWVGMDGSGMSIRGTQLLLTRYRSVVVVDLDRPTAEIEVQNSGSGNVTWVGQSTTLSAARSVMPFGSITGHEWDLDGDGTFERSTGTTPTVETTFATDGTHDVRVRVSAGAATSVATLSVTVHPVLTPQPPGPPGPPVPPGPPLPPGPPVPPGPGGPTPPAGRVGISINDGAQYTNDPRITVRLVWPSGARTGLLANDGGFRNARSFPLTATIPWTLASSGPERLPKTVYLRFDASGNQTFTDDIILDQTAPRISAAAIAPAASSRAASSRAAKKRSYRVRLKATDRTSGVGKVQFSSSAGKRKRAGKAVTYRRTLTVRGAKPKFVRVQDKAGNFSSWRRLK